MDKFEQNGLEYTDKSRAVASFLRDPKRMFRETGHMFNRQPVEVAGTDNQMHSVSFGQIRQTQRDSPLKGAAVQKDSPSGAQVAPATKPSK